MKVFISADIEGVVGAGHWDETDREKACYEPVREQMCAEVTAACEGAMEAGATEIWVRDAHDSARNLLGAKLPKGVKLVRGWAPDLLMMMQEIDASFDAAAMIGYHSCSGSGASPLSHTMTTEWHRIQINGADASEFLINTYAAEMFGVPVVFVSGDQGICEEVSRLNPSITTASVKVGKGRSTVDVHPEVATDMIRKGMALALQGDRSKCRVALPDHFRVELEMREHPKAFRGSLYPGAQLIDDLTIAYENSSYLEILRFLYFV
jgi:D-amino peptidase